VDGPILTLLRLCFLALLYLFCFRVLQTVWKGSTTRVSVQQVKSGGKGIKPVRNKQAKPTPANGKPTRLLVLEPTEKAGAEYILESEISIGRSSSCQIILQDTFISQLHARIMKTPQGVVVEDLGSTNGTYLNNEKLKGSKQAQPGDRIRVGSFLLELR